jgi:hypothetical protein
MGIRHVLEVLLCAKCLKQIIQVHNEISKRHTSAVPYAMPYTRWAARDDIRVIMANIYSLPENTTAA